MFCSCRTGNEKAYPLIHAHRGGAALYPENTITAMIHAVDVKAPVLEMDLHITRDSQDSATSYTIYSMDYDSLRKYDVGSLPNPDFPVRRNMKAEIPLLSSLIDSVETYAQKNGKKSLDYRTYTDLCMKVLDAEFMKKAEKQGMKIVGGTVDTKEEIVRMTKLGIVGIITNQPDSAIVWVKGK